MNKHAGAVEVPGRPAPTRPNNGWAPNAPTPKQIAAFFSQIPTTEHPRGINTTDRLQQYLRNAPFSTRTQAAETLSQPQSDARYRMVERLEEDVLENFPGYVSEISSIMAPFCVPDGEFDYDIQPLIVEPERNSAFTPEWHMGGLVQDVVGFWLKTSVRVKVHELKHSNPLPWPELNERQGEFFALCHNIYGEERRTQYNLNGELGPWVTAICNNVAHTMREALRRCPAFRFELMSLRLVERIANSLWSFAQTAVTLAAVGDLTRMRKVQKLIEFQLKGNPIIDYNKAKQEITVLCSPRFAN